MANRNEKKKAANSPSAAKQRTTKSLWLDLLQTSFFILAVLAVLVIGSLAWFTAYGRVQSNAASVSAGYEIIRIASKGIRQPSEETLLNLPEGTQYIYNEEPYYYTDGGTIALRLAEEYIVSPGTSGSVTFYIIPTRDGAMEVMLYLGLAGYEERTLEEGGKRAERVKDATLDALLSGHILLFRDYAGGHYEGWLNSDSGSGMLHNTITVSLPESSRAGVPYPVTFYWIWPLRYENMVDDLYAPDSTEYTDRFRPFVEAQAENMTPITANYRYSRIFLTREASLSATDSRSRAYNLADEYIGTNADYLYLTIQTAAYDETAAD